MSGDAWLVLPTAAVVAAGAVAAAVLDAGFATGRGRVGAVGTVTAETARLLRQGARAVVASDGLLRRVGCAVPLTVALLMALVVPYAGAPTLRLPVGLVWFNAADVLLWAGWWLVGWGSNSAFALIGAYRFLAQALAYELPLMFSLAATAVAAGSLSPARIVAAQHDGWFVAQMPIALVVYLAAAVGFSMWGPLAHPMGGDVAGGLAAELSGMDRLLIRSGRYALLAVAAAMGAALYLGGGDGPWLPGWAWMTAKSLVVLAALVMTRRLPVLPAERVMRVAWLGVLPLTILQLLVVSVIAAVRG